MASKGNCLWLDRNNRARHGAHLQTHKGADGTAKTKARLLLVDDHEIVRQDLARLLQGAEGFEICGEAATGEDAICEADWSAPDIVITVLRLPGIDGLQATRSILKAHPRTDVLILTVVESEQVLRPPAPPDDPITRRVPGFASLTPEESLLAIRCHPHFVWRDDCERCISLPSGEFKDGMASQFKQGARHRCEKAVRFEEAFVVIPRPDQGSSACVAFAYAGVGRPRDLLFIEVQRRISGKSNRPP